MVCFPLPKGACVHSLSSGSAEWLVRGKGTMPWSEMSSKGEVGREGQGPLRKEDGALESRRSRAV